MGIISSAYITQIALAKQADNSKLGSLMKMASGTLHGAEATAKGIDGKGVGSIGNGDREQRSPVHTEPGPISRPIYPYQLTNPFIKALSGRAKSPLLSKPLSSSEPSTHNQGAMLF